MAPSSTLQSFELGLPSWCDAGVKGILGLSRLERRYLEVKRELSADADCTQFCIAALSMLGVSVVFDAERIALLKKLRAPMLFVANHPFGGVEALALMALMGQVRADYRFVGNAILTEIQEIAPALLPVNIVSSLSGRALMPNHMALLAALRHLRAGGVLGMFPAGEVAELRSWRARRATERAWHPHLATLARKSGAFVVPVYFEGQSSALFRYAGLIAPRMRLALLAREMLRPPSIIAPKIGSPIEAHLCPELSPTEFSAWLQARCFALAIGSA